MGNAHEAVLVDVGISCREIEKRLKRLSLDIQKIKAIFVSHEHTDHIRGIEVLSRKFQLPVFITDATLKHSGVFLQEGLSRHFDAYRPIVIGELTITAFPKLHDAKDPHSFLVSGNGINVGVFTDIGHACEHVTKNFNQCHAVFLEANYDETMLEDGPYPYYLKKRIQSRVGHLSNDQALELFLRHRSASLSHVLLSHLSKENNDAVLVHDLFTRNGSKTKIVVASRECESKVFHIGENSGVRRRETDLTSAPKQTSLF